MTLIRLRLQGRARAITVNRAFVCGPAGAGSYTRTTRGRGSGVGPTRSGPPERRSTDRNSMEVDGGNTP
jgi:hypothetical protein